MDILAGALQARALATRTAVARIKSVHRFLLGILASFSTLEMKHLSGKQDSLQAQKRGLDLYPGAVTDESISYPDDPVARDQDGQ